MELLGRRLRLVALLEIGDLSAADAEITAFERRAATIRQPLYGWYAPLWRGARAMMSGDLAEAQSWLAAAEAAGESAQSVNAMMLVGTHRALAYFETGRSDELAAMISSIVELFSGEPRTDVQVMTALARAAGGDLDGPRRFLDGLGITGLAALPADSEWLPCLVQVTYLVTLLGGHPVAGWLYDALLPHRRRHAVEGIGAFSHGSVERPLGLLAAAEGRREDAKAHFEAALADNRSAGAALLVARTLHDGGVAMGDAGWLAQARDAYRALGLEARAAEVDAALGTSGSSAETGTDAGAAFRRDGEVWALSWNGTTVRLGDRKGLADLAALLSRPGREVAALELAGAAGVELGGDLGELLDAPARAAYQRRITELDAELADADEAGDQQRSTRATAEREALLAQLSAAYGLSRRPRRIGAAAERARQAVTARIRDALGRIEAAHPDLGAHLRRSVRTGTACVYLPDEPVTWRL
jgi:tetratricopeptide (TPR) repeat protein